MSGEWVRGVWFGIFVAVILQQIGIEFRRRWSIRIERKKDER